MASKVTEMNQKPHHYRTLLIQIYLISISDEFLPHGTDLRLVGWYSWIISAISPST